MNENPLIPHDATPEPDDADGLFRRGNRHLDAGEYAEAVADYSAAIRLDPTDADPFFNRGLAHRHGAAGDRAIGEFGVAVELDPQHGGACYQRGLAHAHLRDWPPAG